MTQINRKTAIALAKEAGMAGMLTDVVCSLEEIHRLCNLAVAHSRKDAEPVEYQYPHISGGEEMPKLEMNQPIYWQWRNVHEQWDVANIQDTQFANPIPVGHEGRALGVMPSTDMEVIGWARPVEGSDKYSITQIFRVAEIWKEQGCYVFCLLGIPTPKGVPI